MAGTPKDSRAGSGGAELNESEMAVHEGGALLLEKTDPIAAIKRNAL